LFASICCCFFFGFKTMLPFIGCKLDCCLKLGIKEHGFQSLLGLLGLGVYGVKDIHNPLNTSWLVQLVNRQQ
jgi:hypothetical protein